MPNRLMTPHKGITFNVTYKIDPNSIEEFIEALRPAWDTTRRIPECIYFEVFQIRSEPGTLRITEVWTRDMAWIEENHVAKDYFQTYRKATEAMVLRRDFEVLDRLESWNVVKDGYLEGSVKENDGEL